MPIRIFSKQELQDLGLPYDPCDTISFSRDEIVGKDRWSIRHRLIFQLREQPGNQAYEVFYSVGATESQDERPWEYDKEIEAVLVELIPVTTKQWMPVKDNIALLHEFLEKDAKAELSPRLITSID